MTREVITREQFLKPMPRQKVDVQLPELGNGAVVPVWSLTAKERAQFERDMMNKSGKTSDARMREVRERLVVACCRTDDGEPIFTLADVQAIGEQNAKLVERIVDAAMTLIGMKAPDLEELAKNSDETDAD